MSIKRYKQIRVAVAFFIAMVVSTSFVRNSFLLAILAVLTGMLFMLLVRSKTKLKIDEREKTIREKAAETTYAIFTPTIAIGAILMLIPSRGGISVFSKGEWLYIESLGMIFVYLTLFLITLYSLAYHFFNQKYGGGGSEE
jgi:uncharacterized membrane protein